MSDLQERLTAELSGSYVIERELGGGGMSRVFLATETLLDRRVVIKVLPEDLAAEISADRNVRSQLQPHAVHQQTAQCFGGLAER